MSILIRDADIEVLIPSLYEVLDGPSAGATYLVDRYLGSAPVIKLSGTRGAGHHSWSDLLGITGDTLAHWTYLESGCSMVLVDIQGNAYSLDHHVPAG
jgi:hypothetical protein